MLVFTNRGSLMKGEISPDGSAHRKRNTDKKYITPVDRRQDSSSQESEKRSACTSNHVDAHRQPALIRWERIGNDCRRVGHQERTSHCLNQAEDNNLHGGAIACSMD